MMLFFTALFIELYDISWLWISSLFSISKIGTELKHRLGYKSRVGLFEFVRVTNLSFSHQIRQGKPKLAQK